MITDKEIEIMSNFRHITYKQKIERAYEELIGTDPNKVIKRWWKERDNLLGGIYGWKIYLIWADTGVWKSTFVSQVAKNVSDQWCNVVKYSLEDRMEDIGKEELFYECNRIRRSQGKQFYSWIKFVNNEYMYYDDETVREFMETISKACDNMKDKTIIELDKDKQVNLESLIYLMEEQCDMWANMFIIDHLHYFEFEGDKMRLDLQIQNVMHKINEVARKRNVAVFLVAHYKSNRVKIWEPSCDLFKDGASIKQVANIIIQIEREAEESKFHITKMRWPIRPEILSTTFDLLKYEYNFTKYEPKKNWKIM